MTVEAQFLLALYALAVTVGFGLVVYALMDAKRTIRMLGLAAEARQVLNKVEESVKKTIAEADEIISEAKRKVKTAPKTRAATQKAAAKSPRAVTQRKVVTPK